MADLSGGIFDAYRPIGTPEALSLYFFNPACQLSTLITPSNPAVKGETVLIYATGPGPVNSSPGTGNPASTKTLSPTQFPVSVTFGSVNAHVAFSGLAPTFVGLYQINAIVPAATGSGSLDLIVGVNGVASKPVKTSVR